MAEDTGEVQEVIPQRELERSMALHVTRTYFTFPGVLWSYRTFDAVLPEFFRVVEIIVVVLIQ